MQIPIWHKEMIILPQLSDVPSCYEDSCTSVKEELAHVSMTSHRETQFLPSPHQAMQITGHTCLFSLKHRLISMKGSERFFLLSRAQTEGQVFVGSQVLTISPKPPITEHHKV